MGGKVKMKKSADITKYDPDWQMTRIKVKGQLVPLEDKLKIVKAYYNRNQTMDALERIKNWLTGLQMGYRASGDVPSQERTALEYSIYNGYEVNVKQISLSKDEIVKRLKMYPYNERLSLWKDLYDRNKRWLIKGYNNIEHNNFTDALYQVFKISHEQIPPSFSREKLDELKNKSAILKNTHKFFF